MLTVNEQVLGEVHNRRGIFQDDSLSPLLFVIAMMSLTIILSKTGLGNQTSKIWLQKSHFYFTWMTSSFTEKPKEN